MYLPMCICLPERLQTDIWVWEAMVLDLPINQVLKDAVLGSAGHLACAHKYKYSVLVCRSAEAPTRTVLHTNTNTVNLSSSVFVVRGHPTKTVHTRCPRKKRVNPSLGRMQRIHLGTEVDTVGYSWVPERNQLRTVGEPVHYLGRMQRMLYGTAGYSWVLESRYCA